MPNVSENRNCTGALQSGHALHKFPQFQKQEPTMRFIPNYNNSAQKLQTTSRLAEKPTSPPRLNASEYFPASLDLCCRTPLPIISREQLSSQIEERSLSKL